MTTTVITEGGADVPPTVGAMTTEADVAIAEINADAAVEMAAIEADARIEQSEIAAENLEDVEWLEARLAASETRASESLAAMQVALLEAMERHHQEAMLILTLLSPSTPNNLPMEETPPAMNPENENTGAGQRESHEERESGEAERKRLTWL